MDAESIRSEVAFRFSRSSGPGGQHAQKSSTRVEALFDVEESAGLTAGGARAGACESSARSSARSPRTSARSSGTASSRPSGSSSSSREAVKVRRRRKPTKPTAAAREAAARRQAAPRRDETAPAHGGRLNPDAIIDEARAARRSGRARPTGKSCATGSARSAAIQRDALRRLERVGAVHRARTTVAPAAPPAIAPRGRPALLASEARRSPGTWTSRGATATSSAGHASRRSPSGRCGSARRPDPRADYRAVRGARARGGRRRASSCRSATTRCASICSAATAAAASCGARSSRDSLVRRGRTRWQRRASAS